MCSQKNLSLAMHSAQASDNKDLWSHEILVQWLSMISLRVHIFNRISKHLIYTLLIAQLIILYISPLDFKLTSRRHHMHGNSATTPEMQALELRRNNADSDELRKELHKTSSQFMPNQALHHVERVSVVTNGEYLKRFMGTSHSNKAVNRRTQTKDQLKSKSWG